MAQDTPMGGMNTPGGIGTSTGTDTGRMGSGTLSGDNLGMRSGAEHAQGDICPTCGHSNAPNRGLEQFLGRLGISDDMVDQLRNSMQNVDVEQYLNTARDYLSTSSSKATAYAKENPGKVAAGVAALAVGAGLLISALNRE